MQFVPFVCHVHEFCCFHVMCSMMCSNDPFFTVERYLRSSVLLSKFPPLIFHFQKILLPYFKIYRWCVFNDVQYIYHTMRWFLHRIKLTDIFDIRRGRLRIKMQMICKLKGQAGTTFRCKQTWRHCRLMIERESILMDMALYGTFWTAKHRENAILFKQRA